MKDRVIIVGAGCGGLETSLALRANGWQGEIDVYDADPAWPYHKPPLSKEFLKQGLSDAELQYRNPEVLAQEGIQLHLGQVVTAIDRSNNSVRFAHGDPRPYGHLVLALGGRARSLPLVSDCAPSASNVFSLRTQADAKRLSNELKPGARLVILGGGFIGLEIAAAARAAGLEVVVLEAGSRLLARAVAPIVSEALKRRHAKAGVTIETDVRVDQLRVNQDGAVTEVLCGGRTYACDLMVIAVGQEPVVEIAQAAGLPERDGILVNHAMTTTDPLIHVVGDCARFESIRYGRALRLESVPNALDHARRLAAALCGQPEKTDAVPWFWTDQYDISLKMAGIPRNEDEVILRGSTESNRFSVVYHSDGQVNAVQAVNLPGDFMGGRKLIESGEKIDPAELSDTDSTLMRLLQSRNAG